MIKLVAFDLDGTIGDTIPMCLKALKKAVTPYVTLNDVSENDILAYIIHSGFISGYQNRYGDNLKPPTNVYHRMTA